jgi:hypothetical protein
MSGHIYISRHRHRRLLYAYFPPYRWWKNSDLYHRWVLWRWKRSMRRLERVLGQQFMPTMERATAAVRAWTAEWDSHTKPP